MANRKSTKKSLVTNKIRRTANRSEKARILTSEKRLRAKLDEKDIEGAEAEYKEVASLLDKAAKHNTIHQSKADRKKSRLAGVINKVKAG